MFLSGNALLYRNMTYRFRFLNAHFDTSYFNFSLVVFYKQVVSPSGLLSYVETDPPLYSDNFTDNMHIIKFTVIGTDSSLLNKVIPNIEKFDMAAG